MTPLIKTKQQKKILPPYTSESGITFRTPVFEEIEPIIALFEEEVKAGRMLKRDPVKMAKNLEDWVVGLDGDVVVGCVSLVRYNRNLCELRSLAVDPGQQGKGIGTELVNSLVRLADIRGYKQVLTLTRASELFIKKAFIIDSIENFPEKVRRDCAPCPFKDNCDEVALIFNI